jgi:hypothetical protein
MFWESKEAGNLFLSTNPYKMGTMLEDEICIYKGVMHVIHKEGLHTEGSNTTSIQWKYGVIAGT